MSMMSGGWSIRGRVLTWLFLAMVLVFSANLVSGFYSNREAADRAFDRVLLASASAIAERTAFREERLHVDIPYAALDMLASTAQDRVFYAVIDPAGGLVTGYDGLLEALRRPARSNPLVQFQDADFKGVGIRVVALRTFLSGKDRSGYATILVAQTRGDRDALTLALLKQNALWMLAIALVGAATAWIGVSMGLRPLIRLREALGRRSPDDVRPVLHDVPREFQPLVSALNAMLSRIDGGFASMRNFISDASHQLKTPLASLQAQGEMALRETDPKASRAALEKVNHSLRRTSRLAEQLLSHARATDGQDTFVPLDLAQVAREAVEILLPQSGRKSIDLGYEGPDRLETTGDRALLGELVLNLADNAVKYAPAGAVVTIRLENRPRGIRLTVEDNGPGIPAEERVRVFERFVRLERQAAEGCGLGLAIVREVAGLHDADVTLADGPEGGLAVHVDFPLTEGKD